MISASFAGHRTVSAPLTWGQRAIWRNLDEFANPYTVLNLPRTLRVPDRAAAGVGDVSTAIGRLVDRHESLRTRFHPGDGTLRQVASAGGELPVRVRTVPAADSDPDGARAAGELAAELAAAPFDHQGEWPLRAGLVVVGERVRQVALVFSHAAADFHAAEIALRDLRLLLLRGSVPTPAGWQSVDIAEHEQHHEGPRAQRAATYWLDQYARLPAEMFPPVGPGSVPRYRVGRLVSGAVGVAARSLAARHRVSTATVLLAAIAAGVSARGDLPGCGMVMMSSNRFRDRYRAAVATLNQLGVCHVDLADRPRFAEVLIRAWHASLAGYRYAYYDPAVLIERFAAHGHDLYTALAPFCYLNDIRLPYDPQSSRSVEPVDPAALRALAERSSFTWAPPPDRFAWRCRIQVLDAPNAAVELVVTADTVHLPAPDAERLLRGVEATLVEAAGDDAAPGWWPVD
ncbi:condensation domain-containing protein [Solwaraspora sp. WMMD406]|uniref:condensation domain-containing protein n=1 Tax=Solwaraspora sp. WMMD406 TaxID=3016095 RepID=UPI002416F576|nr:condensation domain-containing protein [Solwaraspora sp. WMMD406]MDG4764532.1 condensation domain-containing protein [Solwaraspora sp. WMMD406]